MARETTTAQRAGVSQRTMAYGPDGMRGALRVWNAIGNRAASLRARYPGNSNRINRAQMRMRSALVNL